MYQNNNVHEVHDSLESNSISFGGVSYVVSDVDNIKIIKDFDELLNYDSVHCTNIINGIYSMGFNKPTPIQSLVIPQVIEKRDIVMQSRSGSGKTAAFTISALFNVNIKDQFPHILILSNTHELAFQTKKVIESLSVKIPELKIALCIGGGTDKMTIIEKKRYLQQEKKMIQTSHIIVGTLGKTFEMLNNGTINSKDIKFVVIDEADKFIEDERGDDKFGQLIKILPGSPKCQIVLSSATFSEEVMNIVDKILQKPIKIMMKDTEINVTSIKQYQVDVKEDYIKPETLDEIYQSISIEQAVIFVNTVERAIKLRDYMEGLNHKVSLIHGKMKESERREISQKFATGHTKVLIATDLYARGIDVQQVNIVINYDFPRDHESYLHRVGRAGRFGRNGFAISFVTDNDKKLLKEISEMYEINIKELPENFQSII
jgi:superfamily II DNA/RNA helicase